MSALSNNGGYIGYDEEYGLGKVISNGLILSLEVDRKSSYPGNGSTFYDLSGSGYNNTLVNGPIYNNVDNYLSFDGTSQYSKFAVTSTSALTNISVFMWVYPLSDGIFAEMLGTAEINAGYHQACIDILSTGVFRTALWNGTGQSYVSSPAQAFNRWHNIGFTHNGTTMVGYINGVSFGSTNFTWSPPNPTYLGIFGNDSTIIPGGVNAFGHGRLASVAMYNRALSSSEVLDNYNRLKGKFEDYPDTGVWGLNSVYESMLYRIFPDNMFSNTKDIFNWSSTNAAGCTLSRDTSQVSPIGGSSLKMAVTGTDPQTGTYNTSAWNITTAAAGQKWQLRVFVKASASTTAQPFLFSANSSGTYLEAIAKTVNIGTDWTEIVHEATFTNASTAFVQCRLDGPDSGGTGVNLWWDGLQIRRIT